eukprot:523163-Prymnesium_polylepis.1
MRLGARYLTTSSADNLSDDRAVHQWLCSKHSAGAASTVTWSEQVMLQPHSRECCARPRGPMSHRTFNFRSALTCSTTPPRTTARHSAALEREVYPGKCTQLCAPPSPPASAARAGAGASESPTTSAGAAGVLVALDAAVPNPILVSGAPSLVSAGGGRSHPGYHFAVPRWGQLRA